MYITFAAVDVSTCRNMSNDFVLYLNSNGSLTIEIIYIRILQLFLGKMDVSFYFSIEMRDERFFDCSFVNLSVYSQFFSDIYL